MGTDDAGQSSVLASVHPVLDPSMEPLVRDSVGQTTSLPAVELGNSIEEDERVRPRSVNLLGDSRVIDSQHAHNISMPHYSPSFLSSSQFESCCGSDRTSCRPSPLSLLSGISTATLYPYIHTYYILYPISGRLTLQMENMNKLNFGCVLLLIVCVLS